MNLHALGSSCRFGRRYLNGTCYRPLILVMWFAPQFAVAQSWWAAADGDWNEATNWTPATVPGAFDAAGINNDGTAHLTTSGVAFVMTVGSFPGGSGRLELTGDGTLAAESIVIGYQNGSTGTVTVDGADAHLSSSHIYVGDRGTGTLLVDNGGTIATQSYSAIGNQTGSSGTATITGDGSIWSSPGVAFKVGAGGTGVLNIADGGRVESGNVTVGLDAGGMGTVEVVDPLSTWQVGGNLTVGDAGGLGRLDVTAGGTVETSGDARIGNLGADGTVTLDTAGSPDPENLYSQWVVRDINVGSLGTGRLSILNGSKITSRNSVIGDTAGLNTGNVAVSGSGSKWTSTGPLTVASTGTLALADDAVVEAAGNVVVDSSGAIQGQGTIVGDVTNGGAVVPGGTLIDTLVIDGDYAQAAAGVLAFELASSMSNQKLSVTGSVALDGTLQVTLADGFIPALNDSFDLLDWGELPGQLAGAFAAVQLPPLAAGLSWSSMELYTLGQLKVVVGPAGDYNSNGVVDAADYVIWREEIETPEAYDVWKANFGKTVAGSGASHGGRLFGSAAGEAVPEPASIVLVLVYTAVLHRLRRRAKRQNTRLWPLTDKTLPERDDVG